MEKLKNVDGVIKAGNTLFSDGFVATIEKNHTHTIDLIQSSRSVKFAYPNRGVRLCHEQKIQANEQEPHK